MPGGGSLDGADEVMQQVPPFGDLDGERATLRHLGRRRERLISVATAAMHQMRDYLSVAWSAALTAAVKPFESMTWLAAIAVVTDRCGADPAVLRELGLDEFTGQVRRELPRFGGRRLACRIVAAVFEALTCTDGVAAQRRGLLRRTGWALEDLRAARVQRAQVEEEMAAHLGVLGVGASLASIPGMTAATAAAILAEGRRPIPVRFLPRAGQACRGRPGQQRIGPLRRGVAYAGPHCAWRSGG